MWGDMQGDMQGDMWGAASSIHVDGAGVLRMGGHGGGRMRALHA